MEINQQRLYLPRFRTWLGNTRFRDYSLTFLAVAFIYVLALLGGMIIGGTSYGLFVIGGFTALIVGMVIAIYPAFGAYILIFFVYANMSTILETTYGIPDSNKVIVSVLLVGTLARRVMIDDKPIVFRGIEMSLLAVGTVVIVSLTFAPDQHVEDTFVIALDWIKDFVVFFILVQFSLEEHIWKNIHLVLIGTVALLGTMSIIQTVTSTTTPMFLGLANAPGAEVEGGHVSLRVAGPLDDPNFYAMMLLAALPLAVYIGFAAQKRLTKVTLGVISIITIAAILFTYSRGAFIALVIVGILIIIERKLNPYRIVFIGLVLAAVLYPILPPAVSNRLTTITSLVNPDTGIHSDSSFRGRASEIQVAILMFEDYPVLGVGDSNYEFNYLAYSFRVGLDSRLENRQAHSLYLEILAEQGIIGFTAFALMLFMIYKGLFRAKRLLREARREDLVARVVGIQMGLTGYLLASVFLHGDYQRYFYLILALAAACSAFADNYIQTVEAQERQGEQPYQLVDSAQLP